MNIALAGYGKMGRLVEEAAARASMDVVCVITRGGLRGNLARADVCIDFSAPDAVVGNARAAAAAGVALVIGTTGWLDKLDVVGHIVEEHDIGCVYGSNFSIGVNLMFDLVDRAGALFSRHEPYDPFLEEGHHKFKKDAPSGTALSLQRILRRHYDRDVAVASIRAGYIPGTHTVGFDSEADTLTITHAARSRAGFVAGALLAAKWIAGRKGLYEFRDVLRTEG